MRLTRDQQFLIPPMLLGLVVFLIGINWGLPSRKVDPFLFGEHPVWTGSQIRSLVGESASAGGADVDVNPIKFRPAVINDTDAKRAEMIVRYRLYSYQPDEMITFRALQTLPKTHGDPKLYQYGGLWIYPVGVLLKLASWVHLVDVRSDLAFYLDHPEAFGRFYIVARLYVVAFAMAGIWTVFWLARRTTGDLSIAMLASIGYLLLPVVINTAHEAKPHLPAAVLILLAIVAAVKYVDTGSRRHAVVAGALCGASFGMVLTGAMSFILLPMMALLRWRSRERFGRVVVELIIAVAIGVAVYCATNPFVIVHLFGDRSVLQSNLGNSQAMYRPQIAQTTLRHAARLIADGASPVFAIAGAAAILLLARRNDLARKLILIVCLPIVAQFVMLSTDKPGEYARFGLFLHIALMLCAVTGVAGILKNALYRRVMIGAMCAGCCVWSIGYEWHFLRDSIKRTPRQIVAERLQMTRKRGAREMAVYSDPAPYCLPPVNLFEWKILLLDPGAAPPSSTDVLIKPIDEIPKIHMPMRGYAIEYWVRPRLLDTPISWASKPFEAIVRREYVKME